MYLYRERGRERDLSVCTYIRSADLRTGRRGAPRLAVREARGYIV